MALWIDDGGGSLGQPFQIFAFTCQNGLVGLEVKPADADGGEKKDEEGKKKDSQRICACRLWEDEEVPPMAMPDPRESVISVFELVAVVGSR